MDIGVEVLVAVATVLIGLVAALKLALLVQGPGQK